MNIYNTETGMEFRYITLYTFIYLYVVIRETKKHEKYFCYYISHPATNQLI